MEEKRFINSEELPSRDQDERPEVSEYRFSTSQTSALAAFLDQKERESREDVEKKWLRT